MSNGTKRKPTLLDEQFEFPAIEDWRKLGSKQRVLGCDYITHHPKVPITAQPQVIEFELKSDEVWAMGPNMRLKIETQFQSMLPSDGDTPATPWIPCTAVDAPLVIVQPLFLDAQIKEIDMFHGNVKINSNDEGYYVAPSLNTWKFANMDKEQKKMLCPQPCHPGLGVPTKTGTAGWNVAADSEWRKYAETIFIGGGQTLKFDYVPLDIPPFFQNSNYFEEGKVQKVLPMPALDKLLVRINFVDDLSAIFKKVVPTTTSRKIYRIAYISVTLVAEHLRLGPAFKTQLLNKRTKLGYEGVTRRLVTETIPAANTTHKATIQKCPFPEGLFIYALPSNVVSGIYKYSTNTSGNVFEPHNIRKVSFTYNDQEFFMRDPHIGMITNDVIESKLYFDYLTAPPFGMKMDPDKITVNGIHNGGMNTPYPHVFINLCNYGDKTRIVPYLNDGSCLKDDHDLDITFTFGTGGATPGVTYMIYLYYTDNNLTLEMKQKGQSFFTSPYIKLK
jgi:hypothetical protein